MPGFSSHTCRSATALTPSTCRAGMMIIIICYRGVERGCGQQFCLTADLQNQPSLHARREYAHAMHVITESKRLLA